ncbi:MAG: hypothetical protein KDD25_09885 [Bdellovibrionales bacterium]|nr:hypothetical protein [Bdellovibrionales bacterium]
MKFSLIAIGFSLCCVSGVYASNPQSYVICKNAGVARTIRIEPGPNDKGCEVLYTKGGIDQIVGSGEQSNGCDPVLEKVKANLEKHWWKCRHISSVTTNFSED